jgi:hypothetical protein
VVLFAHLNPPQTQFTTDQVTSFEGFRKGNPQFDLPKTYGSAVAVAVGDSKQKLSERF